MDLCVSDSLISYWKKVALTTDTLYMLENKKFKTSDSFNSMLRASLENERKKSRNTIIGVGVVGTLLGVLLGVLLIK